MEFDVENLSDLESPDLTEAEKSAVPSIQESIQLIKDGNSDQAKINLTEMDGKDFKTLRRLVRTLLRLIDRLEDAKDAKESAAKESGYPYLKESSPFSEAVSLLEADSQSDGDVWDVKIIKEGLNVSGTREYTPQALRDIVQHMKRSPVQCFIDHPTSSDNRERSERSVKELLGWYTDPYMEGDTVRAKLHLLNSGPAAPVTAMIREAAMRGNKNLVGLSIRGIGDNEVVRQNSTIFERVNRVKDLVSADAVTRPGAGGRLISIAESENQELRRFYMDLEKMTAEELAAARPDLVASILEAKKKEDEDKAKAEADKAKAEEEKKKKEEAAKKKEEEDGEEDGEKDEYGEYMPPDKKKKKKMENHMKENEETNPNLEESQRVIEEAKAATLRMEVDRCSSVLERTLSSAALPQVLSDRIRTQFTGKVFEEKALQESVANEKSIWDALLQNQPRSYVPTAQTPADVKEKFAKRMEATILGKPVEGMEGFSGLREAYCDWQGLSLNRYSPAVADATQIVREARQYVAPMKARTIQESLTAIQESTGLSSSWSTILGDTIHRVMLKYYNEGPLNEWEKIVSKVIVASDLKTIRFSRRGGYTVTPSVNEGSPYQERTFPSEEAPTLSFTKYGDLQPLTIEAVINDDLGAIQAIPKELGLAAKFRIYQLVFNLLANNSNVWDGAALAVTSGHANYSTTALSADAVEAGIRMMRSQTPPGATDRPISIVPKYLLVPNELDDLAWRLVTSNVLVLNASAYNATEPNLIRGKYGLEHTVIDSWTDATNWWLVADPTTVETIAVGLYPAREPQMFVQDDETAGSAFTADIITYKTRFWAGVTVLDYRGFQGNIVGG